MYHLMLILIIEKENLLQDTKVDTVKQVLFSVWCLIHVVTKIVMQVIIAILGVAYTLCSVIHVFIQNTDMLSGCPEFWLEYLKRVSRNVFHNDYC